MHFTAANFANGSYSPEPLANNYQNYVDEAIYFTDDPAIVHSFMTKYDDIWTGHVELQEPGECGTRFVRSYPTYPISPDLNFPPDQDYQDRVVAQIEARADAG